MYTAAEESGSESTLGPVCQRVLVRIGSGTRQQIPVLEARNLGCFSAVVPVRKYSHLFDTRRFIVAVVDEMVLSCFVLPTGLHKA